MLTIERGHGIGAAGVLSVGRGVEPEAKMIELDWPSSHTIGADRLRIL